MYGLLLDIFKRVDKLDRGLRYTVGERLKNESLDILKNIYQASRNGSDIAQFKKCLNDILDSIIHIKVLLRVLKDLGVMGVKNYVEFHNKIEKVSKQATGWYNARVL
jgi:hypothetical protein